VITRYPGGERSVRGVTKDDVKAKDTTGDKGSAGSKGSSVDKGKAVRDIALYGFLRLALFLVLTFIIHMVVVLLGMANYFPLLISMTLALILALPLSMFMFKGLRLRVTQQVAAWDADRQAHKQELRNQLRERLDD
jgi:hypothetical protein